ncbi:retrovirus-related pol polyprotein from transposon TNT 1-94 [Tanacetum coccineum]|uniref:Retrovirus-related pol polyprotein from transposon TNT 1-94 n=1 Tax=Tanacetum coccineum TaxID=301880 RepID=A0ABQ4ZSZ1_9ASTR
MLNNQKPTSCKIGLGFDSSKASTSGTKPISFVGSSAENATDGSTIKVHGSTIPGSVNRTGAEKMAEHVFSPPMSSRSDFVITRKKLIHNRIEESKKPSLKPSLKSGLGYVKTESRSKTPPPRRKISSQPRYNTPQPRRNSREPIHQNFYPMNWNNHQSQGFVHMGNCSSIVAIRMDHGQEFDNEVQFGAYCDAQGITHNFSAPRTPQSNGVVERKKFERGNVVKYERLEKELSKRADNVNNKSFSELSKRFSEHEQHSINLELALQQNLKAQLQDKDIAISKLKKLIEKMKVKSMESKFEKPLVIRQPNAFKIQRQSVLGVIPTTSVSRPQLKRNRLEDRVMHNNSEGKKQKVEDHRRNFKFSNNKTSVTACNDSLNAKTSNVNFVCVTYGKCVLNDNHNMCVLHYINAVNSRTKMPMVVPISTREPKRTMNQSATTPLKRTVVVESTNQKPRSTIRKQYEQISKTFEGLNHNLFSVGQISDADLEVAFWKSTCFIRDLKGNDLLTGSRGTDLYSITLQVTYTPNPICLMAKASSTQAWLWHHRLSHLNFDTINMLSKYDIVIGLPKFKFVKDHLCSSCELGKAKRKSFKTKTTPSSKRRLQILHMDLCGPMRVEIINGKKYVLVIVDDYSRYTWTHFLRSKEETPELLIDFLKLVQRGLHAQVRTVRTDKRKEFLNKTLHAYFAQKGIEHQTSTARTPEQNGVVER